VTRYLEYEFKHALEVDPAKAAKLAGTIFKAVEQITLCPGSAPPGRIEGTRQLSLPKLPFVINYNVGFTDLHILRILHTRRHPGHHNLP
jgi:plasmid stabilization system protein ParE